MMKTKLKKMLGLTALGMTLLASTVPTWAGSAGTQEVFVYSNSNATGTIASGSMVGARYSADSKQYIGCTLHARPNAAPSITCSALTSAGKSAACTSTDPEYVEQTQRLTDSSYLRFEVNHGQTACQKILIHNRSYYLK
jgi:hypothetical protein